jgi:hypothetical protein
MHVVFPGAVRCWRIAGKILWILLALLQSNYARGILKCVSSRTWKIIGAKRETPVACGIEGVGSAADALYNVSLLEIAVF